MSDRHASQLPSFVFQVLNEPWPRDQHPVEQWDSCFLLAAVLLQLLSQEASKSGSIVNEAVPEGGVPDVCLHSYVVQF